MATLRDVLQALHARGGFECIEQAEAENQVRLLGRVPMAGTSNWLLIVHQLLSRMTSEPWKVDISKNYFHRAGKVVFAWRLIFQGTGIANQYGSISGAIAGTPSSNRSETMEQPLVGASSLRMETRNGKGASSVGTAPLIATRGR